jgi:hypothetical protein
MSYQVQFKGWESLTIEDLLKAYRKAKADSVVPSLLHGQGPRSATTVSLIPNVSSAK